MEISVLPKGGLKVKGKSAAVVFHPKDKTLTYNVALFSNDSVLEEKAVNPEAVVLHGPGEYEIAGVKISGFRAGGADTVYSVTVDNVDVLIGRVGDLDKLQHKLKEHNLLAVEADTETDASFATSLAVNALLFYGEKAPDSLKSFANDTIKELPKYQTTLDKLPAEMETILLVS